MSSDRDIGIVDNGSYTVKKDDYLYKIARNHHVSIKYLLRINNIKQPDLIYPGQIIKL
nr:LysM domain-containing protein [Vibrio furnissii]